MKLRELRHWLLGNLTNRDSGVCPWFPAARVSGVPQSLIMLSWDGNVQMLELNAVAPIAVFSCARHGRHLTWT